MTKALDAAIQAAQEQYDDGEYPATIARAALRAALPAEPSDDYVEEYSRRRLPAIWRAIDEGMANVSSHQEIIREARKDVLALRAHLLGEDA